MRRSERSRFFHKHSEKDYTYWASFGKAVVCRGNNELSGCSKAKRPLKPGRAPWGKPVLWRLPHARDRLHLLPRIEPSCVPSTAARYVLPHLLSGTIRLPDIFRQGAPTGSQQRLHHLQVVAEDEHVAPFSGVLTVTPKRTDWLERHGERVGENVLHPFLAMINKLVFSFLRWEQDPGSFGRKVLALFQQSGDLLSLFRCHGSSITQIAAATRP